LQSAEEENRRTTTISSSKKLKNNGILKTKKQHPQLKNKKTMVVDEFHFSSSVCAAPLQDRRCLVNSFL